MRTTKLRWSQVRLGDVCELRYGKSLPEGSRKGGPVPVYGSNGVVGYHNQAVTDGPTIIIGRKGSLGEVAFSPMGCWPIDTTYYVDSSATSANIGWLAYCMRQLRLTELNRAAAVPGLNRDDAYAKTILLPPAAEQNRIASILDKADTIRRKRAESLCLADDFLKSAFLGMFGDPMTNPKSWDMLSLLDVLNFTTGKLDSNAAVSNGAYPFFTCSKETFSINEYAFDCEALLLAGNNAAGEYSVKHYIGKFNAYQRTYVITTKKRDYSYEYFKMMLELKLGELKHNSKGTNTKYLTMGIFERMFVPVPPAEKQRVFSGVVSKVNRYKYFQLSSSNESSALFNSLVQRAFRGEL